MVDIVKVYSKNCPGEMSYVRIDSIVCTTPPQFRREGERAYIELLNGSTYSVPYDQFLVIEKHWGILMQ